MSTAGGGDILSSACTHTHVIDDYREGVSVCMNCCRVVEERLFLPSYEHITHISCKQNEEPTAAENELLKDACDRLHLPKCVLDDSIEHYCELQLHFSKNKENFKNSEIAAFALYDTLSKHGVPRPVQDIERYTNIPRNTIWAVESALCSTETMVNGVDLIETYCKLLQIEFYHGLIMKNIAGNVRGLGAIHPQCLCAVVIYLYCKEFNIHHTMKQICKVCDVSSPNIHKIIRRLNRQYVQNISLFYTQ
jgi:transcription initiation factor TFIIIB Brf1 subunit/transcription initiation factor TFIIB